MVKTAANIVSGGATTAGIGAAAGAAAANAAKMAAGTGGMAEGTCSSEQGCTADTMKGIIQNLTEAGKDIATSLDLLSSFVTVFNC